MTAIEFEEYLIEHGVADKQARATAYAVEKFVSNVKPVTHAELESSLLKLKWEIVTLGFVALLPIYVKIFGVV